ncbi:prepilin peptidase CpaA (plasmid) [Carboxydocella thermautotrophica]|nr:prepilin peptidase CpaA [Carboxydocella thermautotrophica]
MLAGFALNSVYNGQAGFWHSLYGFITGAGIFLVPFLLGGLGAGDLKLMAAIGAVAGPEFVLGTAVLGALIGGVMAVTVLIKKKLFWETLKQMLYYLTGRRRWADIAQESEANPGIPYGVALALGAVILAI